MNRAVIVTLPAAEDARFDAVHAYARRSIAAGAYSELPPTDGGELGVLTELGRMPGRLVLREEADILEILYVPPPKLRQAIATRAEQPGWDPRILKKQRAAFRSSAGAIFRLPAEGSGDEIATFITDWSPFPAAAAIVIHRDHPFAAGASGFSGRFVRNPLTGDLLPVFTAEWVKPEFGTGAVVVNPAHDATDLAYARKVGLPIRFALVDDPAAIESGTWPEPPVIKRGVSIRSGVADGLQVPEAQAAYFSVLTQRGAAEVWTDWSLPAIALAAIPRNTSPARADRATAAQIVSDLPVNASVTFTPLLDALAGVAGAADTCIVTSSAALDGLLLHLRVIYEDLRGEPLTPKRAVVVQKCADLPKGTEPANPEALQLALLICGPVEQPGTVRQQTLEQASAFLRGDEEVRQQAQIGPSTCPNASPPAAILAIIEKWDLVRLFQVTYDAQKAIRANRDRSQQIADLYRTGAFLLTGR